MLINLCSTCRDAPRHESHQVPNPRLASVNGRPLGKRNRPMTKMLVAMTLALAAPAFAGETTVTLAVRNWYCAACPHVVKESLAAVPGVTNVAVSDKTKTAVVTFDDTKADVKALINATTEAGYPSFLYSEGMLWP